MYIRRQQFQKAGGESLFYGEPGKLGKSTLLKALYPGSLYFDLLLSDVFERLLRHPALFRETVLAATQKVPVIVDEIQLIPD